MIITADMIRRFPFAVSPHRISDDLQKLIASDMWAQAKREGHQKCLPPSGVFNAAQLRRADEEADVFRALMLGDRTCSQIATRCGMEHHTVQNAITRMKSKGIVKPTERARMDFPQQYAINEDYAPPRAEAIARSA